MITGQRIKQAREIRGYSRAEFARLVHCTEQKLVRFEADLDEPPDGVMDSIAVVTGFSPMFFRQPPGPEFPLGSLLYHYDL